VRTFAPGGNRLVNGHWEFTPEVEAELQLTRFGRYRLALEREYAMSARGNCIGEALYEMSVLGTWDLAVDRELFERVGGFDEEFPVAGAEDQDFSIRARKYGAELVLDTSIVCLHNDNRIDLRSYCAREERSASTMPFLARKYPELLASSAYVVENSHARFGEPPVIFAKKLAKKALASELVMPVLYNLISLAEASRLPERLLHRLYSTLLGLHLYRGFRSTYQR
jgi:GT2 family glycosyltransferase